MVSEEDVQRVIVQIDELAAQPIIEGEVPPLVCIPRGRLIFALRSLLGIASERAKPYAGEPHPIFSEIREAFIHNIRPHLDNFGDLYPLDVAQRLALEAIDAVIGKCLAALAEARRAGESVRTQLVETLRELVSQIEKSNAIDDHGHEIVQLKALADAKALLRALTSSPEGR